MFKVLLVPLAHTSNYANSLSSSSKVDSMSPRQRNVQSTTSHTMSDQAAIQAEPLIPQAIPPYQDINDSPPPTPPPKSPYQDAPAAGKTPWIPIAAASGACAAFNGVFAKLYVFLGVKVYWE